MGLTITQEIAQMIDGVEYGKAIPLEAVELAKQSGVVIVYGASDDLMEFDGAFRDEVGAFEGGIAWMTPKGVFEPKCENSNCPYAAKERDSAVIIRQVWCAPGQATWTYITAIPRTTFRVMEDGGVFCEGIVFRLEDVGR